MDDIVEAAMARWPNVPAVYGWLELTARGEWRIKGEPIDNAAIRDFIARNYAHDEQGHWFFQNGPQRVFVSIEATPLVYRLDGSGRLQAHTGTYPQELRGVSADADGRLLLVTELGPGLVDGRDAVAFAERLVDNRGRTLDDYGIERWLAGAGEAFLTTDGLQLRHDRPLAPVGRVASNEWPTAFRFVARPGGGEVT